MKYTEEYESEMKNEYLMSYHCGKATRAAQTLGLSLLFTLLLLLAGCGGSTSTNSSPKPASSPVSTPVQQASSPVGTPVQQASATGSTFSTLTLSQAQQQAGYHLLSIPSSLTNYTLTKVIMAGLSGHRVYNLIYSMGKSSITLIEGQPLGNPAGNSKVSLRGTTGTVLTMNNGVTALYWTENGEGRGILGPLSSTQEIALAKSLV